MRNEYSLVQEFPAGVPPVSKVFHIKSIDVRKKTKADSNNFALRYIIPPMTSRDFLGGYKLAGMPNGIYAWIQIKSDKTINNQEYKANTIFARKKDRAPSSHEVLLVKSLQLNDDDIASAGILVIKDMVIVEWNLRTGSYWIRCELDKPEAINKVGLPTNMYSAEGQRRDSDTATLELFQRHFSILSESKPLPPRADTTRDALASFSTAASPDSFFNSSQSFVSKKAQDTDKYCCLVS